MAVESPVAREARDRSVPVRAAAGRLPVLHDARHAPRHDLLHADSRSATRARLYVICRDDGQGGLIRRTNWDDEDLGTISGAGTGAGKLMWPVQFLGRRRDPVGLGRGHPSDLVVQPRRRRSSALGYAGREPGQFNRPSGMAFDADENLYGSDSCEVSCQSAGRNPAVDRPNRKLRCSASR